MNSTPRPEPETGPPTDPVRRCTMSCGSNECPDACVQAQDPDLDTVPFLMPSRDDDPHDWTMSDAATLQLLVVVLVVLVLAIAVLWALL